VAVRFGDLWKYDLHWNEAEGISRSSRYFAHAASLTLRARVAEPADIELLETAESLLKAIW
jgi:hypothetical protein